MKKRFDFYISNDVDSFLQHEWSPNTIEMTLVFHTFLQVSNMDLLCAYFTSLSTGGCVFGSFLAVEIRVQAGGDRELVGRLVECIGLLPVPIFLCLNVHPVRIGCRNWGNITRLYGSSELPMDSLLNFSLSAPPSRIVDVGIQRNGSILRPRDDICVADALARNPDSEPLPFACVHLAKEVRQNKQRFDALCAYHSACTWTVLCFRRMGVAKDMIGLIVSKLIADDWMPNGMQLVANGILRTRHTYKTTCAGLDMIDAKINFLTRQLEHDEMRLKQLVTERESLILTRAVTKLAFERACETWKYRYI